MSFWEIAKNVGTSVAGSVAERANELRQIRDRYEELNDDELMRIANSEGFAGKSTAEKGVAFSILKSRGYSADDLKSR
jgi:hypothetical protein